MIEVEISCISCGRDVPVKVRFEDLIKFSRGEAKVQKAFPYVRPEERELFISQLCENCI